MAYTKTIWNEKTAPGISGAKLNKIEQGIYEAHERISNLAFTPGGTTGDAELVDIRVGADGTTYTNAGEAVRGQVTAVDAKIDKVSGQLSSEIEEVESKIETIFDTVRTKNETVNLGGFSSNGNIYDATNRAYSICIGIKDMDYMEIPSDYMATFFVISDIASYYKTVHYSLGKWVSNCLYFQKQNNSEGYATLIHFKRVDNGDFTESDLNILSNLLINKGSKTVDLFIFMGQSNMAGRGITSEVWTETAPISLKGSGVEFRAISEPTILNAIEEPFGVNENKSDGISESNKTGSMVTAFVNEYYKHTNIPIVAISASKGGTTIYEWQPSEKLLTDAIDRLNNCVDYLNSEGFTIRHKYMLWCQGESDAGDFITKEDYVTNFNNILSTMLLNGIEKMFMVRIGHYNSTDSVTDEAYNNMILWQTEIAQTNENVIMASTDFASMKERGLMKDSFHYYQAGYNECGRYAGANVAFYVNNGKEPTMYDFETDSLYFSKKN